MINSDPQSVPPAWQVPDTEPVTQARSWNPEAKMPAYGNTELWDLGGLGAPTNANQGWGRVYFTRFQPEWNSLARQLAFCMLNPTHALLRNAGIYVSESSYSPPSLKKVLTSLSSLEEYARCKDLPCDFSSWSAADFHSWHDDLASKAAQASARNLINKLRAYGAVTFAGAPRERVWSPDQLRVLNGKTGLLVKTEPIHPEAWTAVLNAALAYVELFSVDILAASEKLGDLYSAGTKPETVSLARVMNWLNEPANLVPLHSPTKTGKVPSGQKSAAAINFSFLSRILGGRGDGLAARHRNLPRAACRSAVFEAVEAGRAEVGGLRVNRHLIDGRPWHDDFSPRTLGIQQGHLRTACYILVAAMSLMRDSEVQEIGRGSVVEYYGAPAVRSVLWKNNPEAPTEYWWIHPVAVSAIEVAEKLSLDDKFIFSSTKETEVTAGVDAVRLIDKFVAFVNEHGERMGLSQINDQIRPHKFRRTMAVIVGQQPGAELAMGVILKHVSTRAIANALSRGYSRPDAAWARHFETDRADAAAGRFIDEWLSSPGTTRAVAGPGMSKFNEVFDAIQEESHRMPVLGDKSELRALLLQENPNLRSGPVNFCLGDPLKAACLSEDLKQPHSGVDPLNCTPAVCSQSAVTGAQMPIWIAEENDLRMMLRKPRISVASKHELGRRLKEVERITKPGGHVSEDAVLR